MLPFLTIKFVFVDLEERKPLPPQTASNGANAYPYDMGDSAAAEMATNGANALDECVVGSYEVVDDGAIYVGRQLDLDNY